MVSTTLFFLADAISRMGEIRISKPDEEVVCTGLLTLSTCIPVLLPHLNSTLEPGHSTELFPMTFDQIVYLGVLTTALRSTIMRALGAKLLASLTMAQPVETLNLLLPLFLDYLEPVVSNSPATVKKSASSSVDTSDSEVSTNVSSSAPPACTGTLEALTAIVEHVSQTSAADSIPASWIELDQTDPLASPDSRGPRPGNAVDQPDAGVADLSEPKLSPLLTSFLPYIVVLVPPVLRLLADPDSTIRVLASRLFTSLLTLFPLESSLPDPPGMSEALSLARAMKRQFIDSLLHPDRIQTYNLPIPIRAKLRGYQQDGVNWLSFLNRYGLNGILCDDLGLGKTLQTLCILAGSHHELKQKHKTRREVRSLVICPSTLCGHWLHEVEQFVRPCDLSPIVYTGGPTVRINLQTQILDHNLVIASYDLVRNDISFFQ
ncbi:unnamed protein product [Echinostoma caproni]|uniref:Helicase ATP-binding domain-containing protein n=1 Tax=Echinostoma caproni TaxID=27848 RepID=A0A183B6C3_9TREM|nr:unnamed protein product [Echinostoma caproni]